MPVGIGRAVALSPPIRSDTSRLHGQVAEPARSGRGSPLVSKPLQTDRTVRPGGSAGPCLQHERLAITSRLGKGKGEYRMGVEGGDEAGMIFE